VTKERSAWEADQCAKWLSALAGIRFESIKKYVPMIVLALHKESRRRKLPVGVDPFWYSRAVEAVAGALAALVDKP